MAKYSISYVYELVDKYSRKAEKIAASTNRMRDKFSESNKEVTRLGKSIAKAGAIMTAVATVPILLLGKNMLNAASDAEETRSKYATVFQELGEGAQSTADSFAKSFGLAGTTARQLLGDTGDMLTGFGFTSEAALKLSKRTNELAVDLASFTNFSGGAKGASDALTKALLGERESVKSLGIAILEVDVKKKIAQMKSEGMRFATEREAKAYATLEIAISQSKNAIGDYARTKASFANVQRRVSERNLELRESFGRIMIPAATKALIVIERLQEGFIGLDEKTKKAIIVIASLVAVLAPLTVVVGGIVMALPLIAAGFSILFSPVAAAVVALTAVFALSVKLGMILTELAFIYIPKFANAIKQGLINAFDAVKTYMLSWVEWFNGVFDKIIGSITKVTSLFKGGNLDMNVNNNPAAQGVANQNTLNGSIDVTASGGASVNSASFKTASPSNIGTTVANQGM